MRLSGAVGLAACLPHKWVDAGVWGHFRRSQILARGGECLACSSLIADPRPGDGNECFPNLSTFGLKQWPARMRRQPASLFALRSAWCKDI
mmetsp:Transcript_72004/g.234040  ORF Transcript_72004/g.234040 Transcript_72004/m.234040 type:complete len:91 (+) Transcript_72004:2416-2688(+)